MPWATAATYWAATNSPLAVCALPPPIELHKYAALFAVELQGRRFRHHPVSRRHAWSGHKVVGAPALWPLSAFRAQMGTDGLLYICPKTCKCSYFELELALRCELRSPGSSSPSRGATDRGVFGALPGRRSMSNKQRPRTHPNHAAPAEPPASLLSDADWSCDFPVHWPTNVKTADHLVSLCASTRRKMQTTTKALHIEV